MQGNSPSKPWPMNGLYDMLRFLASRPGMYLGAPAGVYELQHFLSGYQMHRKIAVDEDHVADALKGGSDFHQFAATKYSETLNYSVYRIIENQAREPLDQLVLYFELLEDYLDYKGIERSLPRIVVHASLGT